MTSFGSISQILEQSVWVLGNIAGEGASSRDAVLAAGVCQPLGLSSVLSPLLTPFLPLPLTVTCLNSHASSQPLLKIGAWTISNLCDGQPRRLGDISLLAQLLGTVSVALLNSSSLILSDSLAPAPHRP
jgi:hypothetical protein